MFLNSVMLLVILQLRLNIPRLMLMLDFFIPANMDHRDLLAHAEQFYPEEWKIAPVSGIHNLDASKTACSVLFSECHSYASSQPLSQVATFFLEKWGAKSVILGKKIACFYHKRQKNKLVSVSEKKVQHSNVSEAFSSVSVQHLLPPH